LLLQVPIFGSEATRKTPLRRQEPDRWRDNGGFSAAGQASVPHGGNETAWWPGEAGKDLNVDRAR